MDGSLEIDSREYQVMSMRKMKNPRCLPASIFTVACICAIFGMAFLAPAQVQTPTPGPATSPQAAPATPPQAQDPWAAQSAPGPPPAASQTAAGQQSSPPAAAAPPANSAPEPAPEAGGFVFKSRAEEVVLHATVVDSENRPVTGLDKTAFTVYEDGKPQTIRAFKTEDVPVALGIVIDNSGSMRTIRPSVNRAAINLVKASQPRDGVFIVNFGDDSYLDQDFTSDIGKLQQALTRIGNRGTTAIYDALVASATHLEKNIKSDKKILLLITDGADNASKESLNEALQQLQQKNGPIIYAIALPGGVAQDPKSHRALDALSRETGGSVFYPVTPQDVDTISQTLARDIRTQYTINYRPTTNRGAGVYHSIQVVATGPTGKLQVRTRTGYYGGQDMNEANAAPVAPSAPPTNN